MEEMLLIELSRQKVRFDTAKGYLPFEDLWKLPMAQLKTLAKNLNRLIRESEEDIFATKSKKTVADRYVEIQFKAAMLVISTLEAEAKAKETAELVKQQTNKLEGILEDKQDESLKDLSEKELRKMIKKLKA